MGGIDGYTYTNSLEAFELNYEAGHRVFEVDMQLTSDEQLACWHDWGYGTWDGDAPTLEEFLAEPIEGEYTALSIEDLLRLMQEHEDIYIVTDSKYTDAENITKEFRALTDAADETGTEDVLDRIIVQIYNEDMLSAVRDVYEFPEIIFTLYAIWDGSEASFEQYLNFCSENAVRHITMWYFLATPRVLRMAEVYGIHIFVHTVNDLELAESLMADGVEGIYTDSITPDDLESF